ncbi:MAG: hypothetical protein KDA35_08765, partial [Hyphomonadaceae bacterium]|nr:hypothetical protein [Hyphomonadaceae bacterium]
MTSDQALWAIAAMLVAVLIGAAQIYQEETKNTIGWLLGRQSILIGDARRMISGGIWTVRERLGQRRTYKVGCFNYSPLSKSTHSESGEESYEGPWPQLTRAIAQKLDIDIQISSISATGFEYPVKITHDIVVGLFRTAWREKYFHFSDPVHRIRLQGICRRDRPRITKEELIDANLGV